MRRGRSFGTSTLLNGRGSSLWKSSLATFITASFLLLGGCATVVAPDETKALGEAADPLAGALQAIPSELSSAEAQASRQHKINDMINGAVIQYKDDCDKAPSEVLAGFIAALRETPYAEAKVTQAFAGFRGVQPCELGGVNVPPVRPAKPIDGPVGNPYSAINAGVRLTNARGDEVVLDKVGGSLKDYVEKLSDLATGESYGKLVDQRKAALDAAGGFADALGAPFAAPAAQLLRSAAESALAAKRNRATLDILDRIDSILPDYMERVGLASRLAIGQTIYADSQLASDRALRLNLILADPRFRAHPIDSLALVTPLDEKLQADNQALLSLREEDPMRAARAFAAAHHALRDVFADPRSSRSAFVRGINDLAEAASGLGKAIADAKKAKDSSP